MSNRHVEELAEVYVSLFTDAKHTFPALGAEFERDLRSLHRLISARGLRLFTIDLPNAGKHLDRCLSEGEYSQSGLPLTKRVSGLVKIPKFLRGLYLLVFHVDGRLREDYSSDAIFFLRQFLYCAKKANVECSGMAVAETIRDFYAVDSMLPEPEDVWKAEAPTHADWAVDYQGFLRSPIYVNEKSVASPNWDRMSKFLHTLDIVSKEMCTALGNYDPDDWRFKHGNGAIADGPATTNKYLWNNWSRPLESRYPFADYGFHNFASWADHVHSMVYSEVEPSSRLICVPKTQKGPRLIAAEPREHMWCQQNLLGYMYTRSANSWIHNFVRFRDQSQNQEMCQIGSRDGSLITVDLSAASDRVTCHVVGQLFRWNYQLIDSLRATRTRWISQDLDTRCPQLCELRKFSTMGSACTFPVESLIFMCVAISATLTVRGLKPNVRNIEALKGQISIFGDDIIVPKESGNLLFEALEALHFKVNASKTFTGGKFRESCGVDSYDGVDVTPSYWRAPNDDSPESVARTVSTSNNFYSKFLVATAATIAKTIRRFNIPAIPADSGAFGLKSFLGAWEARFKTRFNTDLQRREALLPQLITRAEKLKTESDVALHQYFTERPAPDSNWENGTTQRPELKVKLGWVPFGDLGPNLVRR